MLILSAAFFPAKEELVSSLNAPGSTWDWSKACGFPMG